MPLFDVFKKKKKVEKPKKVKEKKEVKKPPEVKIEEKPKLPKKRKLPEEAKAKPEVPKPKAKIPAEAYRILKEPHITEKATELGKEGKYVFKVFPGVNKIEIKKAIEDLYEVDVLTVRIIKISSKRRRLGRTRGWRKGYKKAVVKVRKGQKIEVLPR